MAQGIKSMSICIWNLYTCNARGWSNEERESLCLIKDDTTIGLIQYVHRIMIILVPQPFKKSSCFNDFVQTDWIVCLNNISMKVKTLNGNVV